MYKSYSSLSLEPTSSTFKSYEFLQSNRCVTNDLANCTRFPDSRVRNKIHRLNQNVLLQILLEVEFFQCTFQAFGCHFSLKVIQACAPIGVLDELWGAHISRFFRKMKVTKNMFHRFIVAHFFRIAHDTVRHVLPFTNKYNADPVGLSIAEWYYFQHDSPFSQN